MEELCPGTVPFDATAQPVTETDAPPVIEMPVGLGPSAVMQPACGGTISAWAAPVTVLLEPLSNILARWIGMLVEACVLIAVLPSPEGDETTVAVMAPDGRPFSEVRRVMASFSLLVELWFAA